MSNDAPDSNSPAHTATASSLAFGVILAADDAKTTGALARVCARLGDAAGCVLRPHVVRSPRALAAAVRDGAVQLAWLSPTLLATDDAARALVPLVSSVRGGAPAYHAVLFALAGGPIESLDHVVGARAAWVDPTSAAGYLVPRVALAQRGIDPTKAFSAETFYGSHAAVVRAVLEGEADVGATFAQLGPDGAVRRAGYQGVVPERDGRALLTAGPIPADVIAANAFVPEATRAALTAALVALGSDAAAAPEIDWLFGVEGFAAFDPAAFEPLFAILAAGRERGLLAAPPGDSYIA